MARTPALDCPDGIADEHLREPKGLRRALNPITLTVLGAVLATAPLGLVGGLPTAEQTTHAQAVDLAVHMPRVLRNGEFFETRVRITPKRPIADLQLGVAPSLWRKLTQNSMIPAASDEKFEDGLFLFSYGKAQPGEPVEVKMDFQINPDLFGGVSGEVVVRDGKQRLAVLPLAIKVRP